eukprot:1138710-Pelagomonas_calceolata.AAC.2
MVWNDSNTKQPSPENRRPTVLLLMRAVSALLEDERQGVEASDVKHQALRRVEWNDDVQQPNAASAHPTLRREISPPLCTFAAQRFTGMRPSLKAEGNPSEPSLQRHALQQVVVPAAANGAVSPLKPLPQLTTLLAGGGTPGKHGAAARARARAQNSTCVCVIITRRLIERPAKGRTSKEFRYCETRDDPF